MFRILQILFELLYRVYDRHSLIGEIPSCEDDILTSREYTPYRVECLTSHDDRMTLRRGSEMCEVLWNMPWDLSLISDNTIASHSSDGDIVDFILFERENISFHHFPILLYLFFQLFES